jgi:Glycoside hydrolase family 5 C-terminal domain
MKSLAATAEEPEKRGFRAGEAFVRPFPIAINGIIDSFGFDLKTCTFKLSLTSTEPTSEDTPTEIFVPAWHFPNGSTHIDVSGGKWQLMVENDVQKLKWWHAAGEQSVTIKGLARALTVGSDWYGYYDQWPTLNIKCSVM